MGFSCPSTFFYKSTAAIMWRGKRENYERLPIIWTGQHYSLCKGLFDPVGRVLGFKSPSNFIFLLEHLGDVSENLVIVGNEPSKENYSSQEHLYFIFVSW